MTSWQAHVAAVSAQQSESGAISREHAAAAFVHRALRRRHRQALLSIGARMAQRDCGRAGSGGDDACHKRCAGPRDAGPCIAPLAAGCTVDHARVQELAHTYLGAMLTPGVQRCPGAIWQPQGLIVGSPGRVAWSSQPSRLHEDPRALGLHAYPARAPGTARDRGEATHEEHRTIPCSWRRR